MADKPGVVFFACALLDLFGNINGQESESNQSARGKDRSLVNLEFRRSCNFWPFNVDVTPLMLTKEILQADYQASIPPAITSLGGPNSCLDLFFALTLEEDIILEDQDSTMEVSNQIAISWIDSRLKLTSACRKTTNLTDEEACNTAEKSWAISDVEAILWTPLLEILRLQQVTERDFLFSMKKSLINGCTGKVTFHGKIKYKVKCHLDFSMFPFDSQICPLVFLTHQSKNSVNESFCMKWKTPPNRLQRFTSPKDKTTGNWKIDVFVEEDQAPTTKNYVKLMFEFRRYTTSFIVQTMIPSILMVLASFGSLCVPSNQIPGRMTLAITTCLTHMSMINGALEKAPRTSYLKAIDIWLVTCFGFTFSVLIEFCLVISLTQSPAIVTHGENETQVKAKKIQVPKNYIQNDGKIERLSSIAFMLEKWTKVILPLFFLSFLVIFIGYVKSTEVFEDQANVTKTPLQVIEMMI